MEGNASFAQFIAEEKDRIQNSGYGERKGCYSSEFHSLKYAQHPGIWGIYLLAWWELWLPGQAWQPRLAPVDLLVSPGPSRPPALSVIPGHRMHMSRV